MALEKKWFYYVRYFEYGKWKKTSWQMTADDAARRYGDTQYELVEAGKIERMVGYDIHDPRVMTGAFRNAPKPGPPGDNSGDK